mgnify:CR=1 FL=1
MTYLLETDALFLCNIHLHYQPLTPTTFQLIFLSLFLLKLCWSTLVEFTMGSSLRGGPALNQRREAHSPTFPPIPYLVHLKPIMARMISANLPCSGRFYCVLAIIQIQRRFNYLDRRCLDRGLRRRVLVIKLKALAPGVYDGLVGLHCRLHFD